jgi:hypothetical protein
VCGEYSYSANNYTYTLSSCPQSYAPAEEWCSGAGGHLASYKSAAEQQQVEEYFVELGGLVPGFHNFYWLGLQVRAAGCERLQQQIEARPP